LGAPKQRAVLAVLLFRRNHVVTRGRLTDAVWGERPPEAATRSLQVYVHGLRRALGPDRIETSGGGYRLRVEPGELDLDRFERLVEQARRSLAAGEPARAGDEMRNALALWAGPPLADLADEPVSVAHAGPLDELRLDALELRGEIELALGRHAGLVPTLEPLVAEHPYRERLHEQLVLGLYRSGRQKEALEAQRAARRTFDELGIEPGPALHELERAILRHDPSLAAPAAGTGAVVSLPSPPTPLVGRRLEVAAVTSLFEGGSRLVTLTGPGGTGKTRLALAVAEELAAGLDDGALFVDLAAVGDPALIGPSIAAALEVREGDRPLVDALAERLHSKRMLLLLDNLEQLLPGTPLVGNLLSRSPRLLVLATSRAPLRLAAEQEYPVLPLELADPDGMFEQIAANDAVRLFVQRARAVDPSFQLTDENAASVARLCARLDGLPLAIELAAARTKLLPPEAMVARLDATLDLLTGGARDLAPRQQTLRATLDWSYGALAAGERRLLARLAVFAGGCSVGDVEAVCGVDDAELLATLVEVSLLRRVRGVGTDPRFGMLETIREYARELLRASGEEDHHRRRHCEHVVRLAESVDQELANGSLDDSLFDRLDLDHDNVREALAWAAGSGETELEVRLVNAMSWFWNVRGHLSEGRRASAHAAAAARDHDARLYAEALVHGAIFPYRQGDLDEARRSWEEALELFRGQDDLDGVTRCTAELGAVAVGEGELDRSRELYEEAARGFEQLGNSVRLGVAKSNLCAIASMQGDLEAAVKHGFDAVALQEEAADVDGLAVTLHNLSRTTAQLGDSARSRQTLERSLRIARSLSYKEVIAYCLEGAAEVAAAAGDERLALRLLMASEATFARLGVPMQGEEAEAAEALRLRLAASLGEEELEAGRAAADREAPERAVDAALELLAARATRYPRG
jgi:predicted ATPase/DNA-binding SARP family transcriptional activator